MNKLSKPMLAIFLSIILILSSAVDSFAGDDGDPYGTYARPKYQAIK
jgi:hypothetical protein